MSVQFHSDQHSYIISCWRINLSEMKLAFFIPYVIQLLSTNEFIQSQSTHKCFWCSPTLAENKQHLLGHGFFHLFVILMKNEIEVVQWLNGRGAQTQQKLNHASYCTASFVRPSRCKEMYFEDLSFKLDSSTAVSDLCAPRKGMCMLAKYSEYHKKLSHSHPHTTEVECNWQVDETLSIGHFLLFIYNVLQFTCATDNERSMAW